MAEPNVTELESADAKSLSALEAVISAAEEINQSSESYAQTTEDDACSVDDKPQEIVEAVTDSSVSEIASPDRETVPVHDKPVFSDKQAPIAETSPGDVQNDNPSTVASPRSEEHELIKLKTDSTDSQSNPQSPSTNAPIVAMAESSDAEQDHTDDAAEKSNGRSSVTPAEETSPEFQAESSAAGQLTPQKEDVPSPTENYDTVTKKAPTSIKSVKESASPPRVRRSSRAISNSRTGAEEGKDTPTRVASPGGRNKRSHNNSETCAKTKVSGQKSQTSPGKANDETAMEETEKSEGTSLKRKAENVDEESNNATAPPAEKRSRKPVAVLNTSALEASLLPESHFLSPPTPLPEGEQGKEEAKKPVTVHDAYCWACHTDGQVLPCAVCPRSYHQRCVQQAALSLQGWICPECTSVRNAEKMARASKGPKIEDLSRMLLYALQRVRSVTDCEPFMHEVDSDEVLNYSQYVVNPMDLSQLETKIKSRSYASTRAFLADFRWILHNSIIFNSYQSKLTSVAKSLMKVCRHEMSEIDTCQDCYEHAHTKRDTWFLEPCSRPHLLIWAKLKGYPYWPAKAVKANKEGNVDVRFFGAHDRAWVPVRDCYLYSREVPASNKNKRKANFESSLAEIELHIERLTEMFGEFNYAPNKTPYNPSKEDEQLRLMIPNYKPREVTPSAPQGPAQVAAVAKKPKLIESTDKADAKREEKAASTAAASKYVEKALPDNKSEPVTVVAPTEPDASKTISESDDAVDKGNENSKSPSQDSNKFFSMLHLAPRSALPPPSTAANTKRPVITRMVIRNKNNPSSQPRFVQLSKAEFDKKMRESNSKKPLKVYIAKTIRSGAINSATSPTGVPKPVVIKTTTSLTTPPTSTKPVSSPPLQATPTSTVNPTPSPSHSTTVPSAPEKAVLTPPPVVQTPIPPVIKTEPMDVEEAIEASPQEESSSSDNVADKSVDEEKASATVSSPLPEDDDEVNPAMYLDPTITITLLNQDDKLKSPNASPEKSHNLESEAESRNSVEETVSITLVPKKQTASGEKSAPKGQNLTPKVTFSTHAEETPSSRVIEIDSPALGLTTSANATLTLVSKGNKTPAKARKSMAKSPRAPPALAAQASKANALVPTKVPLPPLCKNAPANGHVNNGSGKGSSVALVASVKPATQVIQQQPFFQPFIEQSTGPASSQPVVSVVPGASSNSTLKTFTSGSGVEYVSAGGGYFLMTRPLSALQSNGASVGVATTSTSSTTSMSSTSVPRLALTAGNEPGHISAFLHSKSQQIAEMIRSSLESLLQETAASGSVEANLVQARLELERMKWNREKEIAEARRSAEALVKEVRANVEAENARQLSELRRQFEVEKKQAVEDAKSRQWCAECGKEAVFYCCWNTAYCDYPCQQEHWAKHMASCANVSLSHGHSSSVTTADRERPSRPTSASDSSSNETRSPDKPGSKLAHYVQIPAARRAAQRKKARLYDNKRGPSPEADDSSDAGLRVDASDEEDELQPSKSPERAYQMKPKVPAPVTQPRRKRCGQCAGCLNTVSCGQCFACKTTNSHRICKDRLCLELKKQKLLRAKERARQLAAQANGKSGKNDKAGVGSAQRKKIAPKPLIPPSRPDLGYSVIAPTSIASSTASNNVSDSRPLPPKASTPAVVVSNATNTNSSVVVTSSQHSMTTTSISSSALRFNPSALTGPVSFIVSSPKGGGNPKIEGVVLGSNQGGGTQTILSPENYMSLMASQNQGQQQQQQQQTTPLPTIALPSLPLGSNATEMPAPMLTSTIAFSNNAPVLHYLRPVTQDKRDEK